MVGLNYFNVTTIATTFLLNMNPGNTTYTINSIITAPNGAQYFSINTSFQTNTQTLNQFNLSLDTYTTATLSTLSIMGTINTQIPDNSAILFSAPILNPTAQTNN